MKKIDDYRKVDKEEMEKKIKEKSSEFQILKFLQQLSLGDFLEKF